VFKDDDDLHEFIIPNGTSLAPNSYIVLAQSLADFQSKFPDVSPVLGDFEFGLSGGGELVRLFDDTGVLVDSVDYDDEFPWPTEADGNGPTLELQDPTLDTQIGDNWDAGAAPGFEHGTPTTVNNDCSLGIEDFSNVKVSVYPNPMKSETTILVSNYSSPLELLVYDMLGREITSLKTDANKFVLSKRNMNSGVYLLKIVTADQSIIQTQKIIVE
jgi:hypothetical protein